MIINCLIVGAGGFVGSVFRYLISLVPVLNKEALPLQTLLVNVLGAIVIGMLIKASESVDAIEGNTLLFLKVGLCGGFTTFSTFALETFNMFEDGRFLGSMTYIVLSVVLCVVGVYIGRLIMQILGL